MEEFSLKTTVVSLYNSGMGHFILEASVNGSGTGGLSVPEESLSDVLKTLTAVDLSGEGAIASIGYESREFGGGTPQLVINQYDTLAELIQKTQGAEMTLETLTGSVRGRIMGLQDFDVRGGTDSVLVDKQIVLLAETGLIGHYSLKDLKGMKYEEEELQKLMKRVLTDKSNQLKTLNRRITISTRGEWERTVQVSYAMASPIWKCSYRVTVEDSNTNIHLQGWAIVENVTDDDWEQVSLRLVSGIPVSFEHDLSGARYKKRPRVKVSQSANYNVPLLEDTKEQGARQDSGVDDFEEESMRVNEQPHRRASRIAMKKFGGPQAMAAPMAAGRPPVADESARGIGTTSNLQESNVVNTQQSEVGQLFEYEVREKVTISKHQSALVPILFSKVSGQLISLYNAANHSTHPFTAVEIVNTSGCVLETGPVTVYEEGRYGGEAMINSITPKDEKLMLPYSMDLRLLVTKRSHTKPTKMKSIVLKPATEGQPSHLLVCKIVSLVTEYSVRNRGKETATLVIEHPHKEGGGNHGFTFDKAVGASMTEKTESYYRLKAEIPQQVENTVVAVDEVMEQFSHTFFDSPLLSKENLKNWFSDDLLTEEMKKWIEKLTQKYKKRNNLNRKSNQLRKRLEERRKDVDMERETVSKLENTGIAKELQSKVLGRLEGALRSFDDVRAELLDNQRELEALETEIMNMEKNTPE